MVQRGVMRKARASSAEIPEHATDALSWVLLKGWLCKPSKPHRMSRLVSHTLVFGSLGHQHRWMSSAARGHDAPDT